MSDFKTRLKALKITQTSLAAKVGIGNPHMCLIIAGAMHPKNELALAIERETGGAITAAELKGLPAISHFQSDPAAIHSDTSNPELGATA
jgi:DNA-binding transcriptional regulator YdaS (Cro superfamily)